MQIIAAGSTNRPAVERKHYAIPSRCRSQRSQFRWILDGPCAILAERVCRIPRQLSAFTLMDLLGVLEAAIRHERYALRDPQDAQGHTQFIMQLEPRMVALGFMAGRGSAAERRREAMEQEENEEHEGDEGGSGAKRERERERLNRRPRYAGAILFPRNELYASRGSRCIIYRSAFHYFFVVHLLAADSGSKRARHWSLVRSARSRSFISQRERDGDGERQVASPCPPSLPLSGTPALIPRSSAEIPRRQLPSARAPSASAEHDARAVLPLPFPRLPGDASIIKRYNLYRRCDANEDSSREQAARLFTAAYFSHYSLNAVAP